jgi:hypothetical protein
MSVLIACESSGKVRDAFIANGYDAVSCDLQPTKKPGPHYQGPVQDILGDGSEWDLIIAFPPCTYLCSSGLHWNKRVKGRAKKTEEALNFVAYIMNAIHKCGKGSLENPIGCISTRIHFDGCYKVLDKGNTKIAVKPTQIIQPYNFGHDASKSTCLYLWGLPKLKNSKYIEPSRFYNGKPRWGNQVLKGGADKTAPSKKRGDTRSETYTGIAQQMADQWCGFQYY